MQKVIVDCLLCNTPLQTVFGWQEFFVRQLPQTICARCETTFEVITGQREEGVVSLFSYNAAMKAYIQRYKFMHDVLLAHVFNRAIHQALREETGIIVPIPMHEQNLTTRTFAQVDELLRAADIPFQHVLKKNSTATQVGKTREERLHREQLFDVVDPSDVKDKNVLLFDDIYTTGTTLQHAKRALEHAGAATIAMVTLVHS